MNFYVHKNRQYFPPLMDISFAMNDLSNLCFFFFGLKLFFSFLSETNFVTFWLTDFWVIGKLQFFSNHVQENLHYVNSTPKIGFPSLFRSFW